jgi:hypothetical protein
VVGTVIQDPQTGAFLIDEVSRTPIGQPAWLIPALIGLGVLVLLLGWALVRTLRGSGSAAPAATPAYAYPGATVRPGGAAATAPPTIRPATAAPAAPPPVAARPPREEATEVLDAGEATEVFRSLGAALRITEGPDAGRTFPIGKAVVLIGRRGRRSNDVTLADTSISREQARLTYNEETDSFTLVNESRTNPTRVDGVTVDARELKDGSTIEVGRTAMVLERNR